MLVIEKIKKLKHHQMRLIFKMFTYVIRNVYFCKGKYHKVLINYLLTIRWDVPLLINKL
jgi:hypothetical protein